MSITPVRHSILPRMITNLHCWWFIGLGSLLSLSCAKPESDSAFDTPPQLGDVGCYQVHFDSLQPGQARDHGRESSVVRINLLPRRLSKDANSDRLRVEIRPRTFLPARLQYWMPQGADSIAIRGLGQHAVRFEFDLERTHGGFAGRLTTRSTYDDPEAAAVVRLERIECGLASAEDWAPLRIVGHRRLARSESPSGPPQGLTRRADQRG
jgi:hypothetical protein